MKITYVGTYEIQTKLFRTQRTFNFRTLDERIAFEKKASTIGVKRVATTIEHLMSVEEAFDELVEEKLRCDDIALGRIN
jgi:hypothetical protein